MGLSLLLALGAASCWGAADFFGGLATRTAKAIGTTLVSQLVGMLGLLIVCALGFGGSFVGGDIPWGVGAGLASVCGLGLFYEAMGRGSFGVVASVTSVVSGSVPIVYGLASGERPGPIVLAGVVIAVGAIWLIAGDSLTADDVSARVPLFLAFGAGLGFGCYFVLLAQTSGEGALWPLVAGRIAAVGGVCAVVLVVRLRSDSGAGALLPGGSALRLAMIAGLFDAAANGLYLFAMRTAMISVVAVLASLYPVSTLLLARLQLKERLPRRRLGGIGVGFISVLLISWGSVTQSAAPKPQPSPTPPRLALVADDDFFSPPLSSATVIDAEPVVFVAPMDFSIDVVDDTGSVAPS
jgi:drug/metabolite transporter (DMT)-like permease